MIDAIPRQTRSLHSFCLALLLFSLIFFWASDLTDRFYSPSNFPIQSSFHYPSEVQVPVIYISLVGILYI